MSVGRTNSGTGGGGGISARNAVIHVLASVGSSITFSKGGVDVKTLDASKGIVASENPTIAEYYYPVNSGNYGLWTVTATKDTSSKSSSVSISANNVYDVNLFQLFLYHTGIFDVEWQTTNKKFTSSTASAKYPSVTKTDDYFETYVDKGAGTYQTAVDIDLTNYSKLYLDITYVTPNLGLSGVMKNSEPYTSSSPAHTADAAQAGLKLIDISALSGGYRVFFGLTYASGTIRTRVRRVWLEP